MEVCYERVCQRLIEQYKISVNPDEHVRVEMYACLNFTDLAKPLAYLGGLYEKAEYSDRVKYGILKKKSTEDRMLLEYLVLKGLKSCEALDLVIPGYDRNTESFQRAGEGITY